MKTFFDPAFDPGIMVGSVTLDFLHDYFTRHNRSIDVVTTILQVISSHPSEDNDLADFVLASIHETC
jgi:hypothetical protein